MNVRVKNFKTIIGFQVVVMMALSVSLWFIEPSTEKDILRGVVIGLMFSLLIQFVLYRLKAGWFDPKVKKYPQ